jgi:hypothetical protein
MKLFGFGYHESDDPWDEAPPWAIELREMMALVLKTEQRMENEMALDFTKLIAATTAQTNVTNSALTAFQAFGAKVADLSAQLATALATSDPVAAQAVQTQMDALATGVQTNDDKLAAAIQAPGTVATVPTTPVAIPSV